MTDPTAQLEQAYEIACAAYAELGVDADLAIEQMKRAPISLHCWQGDDVGGFENAGQEIGGGLAVTGNYLGKARTPDELRSDLEMAYSLIPGKHRLNLHACYGEFRGTRVDRDQIGVEHFQGWIDWAQAQGIGLDFNPTYFAHEKADDGFTLAHPDAGIRQFWIDHGIACRKIGAAMGAAQGSPCVTNVWIPDGFKDTPASRKLPRERLAESLDALFAEPIDPSLNLDAVECKLFGIGSESYVVGSHEFYLGYAITRNKVLCLDAGHFHPTEVISDKISSVMMYIPQLLLHVSRGVRWDSDHVVTFTDELQAIAAELVRGNYLDRVHIGLDFFDASINRVAAWVIGTRNMLKALLMALLEPTELLQAFELEGDFTRRLALMEELKTMPYGAVWDYYCLQSNVPVGSAWLDQVTEYETNVLSGRANESATVQEEEAEMSDQESDQPGGEYERAPVPDQALLGPGKFWGMYAGEHAAGTEFMIGPLFLAAGASLQDLILGLLLGNALAVLTWRYLVVPIAMSKRLTLYYQLERIAGGSLVKLYNVVNGVLFCFLAGAMITVSASAVGIPFGINYEVPDATFGFGAPSFTALVVIVGAVIAVVAAAGYETVARVANIAAPWMIAIFAACGIVSLAQMEATSMTALSEGKYWSDAIAFVQEKNGPQAFPFWQIVAFAWLCNGAMHFGMADLSIFRFARSKASGWAPSIGMFLGHYMAWIAAALLLAALIKLQPELTIGRDGKVQANPGLLAFQALGWAGIICVVIAGWTTANPTIYRAGLAFQGVLPRSSRTAMTLAAGAVATIAGAFPNLSAQLLGFVGTYGTVLGPMGAVVFVDYYLMKKFGLSDEYAHRTGSPFNVAVLIAWSLPVAVGLYLIFWQGIFAAYAVIPAWIACGVIYLLLSKFTQQQSALKPAAA